PLHEEAPYSYSSLFCNCRNRNKAWRCAPTPLAGVERGFVTRKRPRSLIRPYPACRGGARVHNQKAPFASFRPHPGKRGGGQLHQPTPSGDEPTLHPGERGGGGQMLI